MIRLIPAPLLGGEALHPRVVSAGAAGWHFMFITGKQGAAGDPLAFESADVWYGLFDGRHWRRVERVAHTQSASLLPGMSSDLVAMRGGLAFAYSFDRSASLRSNALGNQGIVLLQHRGTRWTADTLRTWEGPRAVQLASDSDGGVRAVFTQSYFAGGRPHGPALFTARHDSHWFEPNLVLDVPPRLVTNPLVEAAWMDGTVLSWQTTLPGAAVAIVEWGIGSADGMVRRIGPIAAVQPFDRPAMLRLGAGPTVWLIRNGDSRHELRVFGAVNSIVRDWGVVHVPLDNFVTRGIALSDRKFLVVTGGLGTAASEPPASSFLTTLSLPSCAEVDS